MRLRLQGLYPATAAVVVQSRLHEPCSLYYFASFYVRQKVSCRFVPPRTSLCPLAPDLAPDPGDIPIRDPHPNPDINLT